MPSISNNLNVDNLENAKFLIDGEELALSEYEKINFNILSHIITGEKSNNVIIHPGGDIDLYIYILAASITQYLRNMDESSNSIIDNLHDGEMVIIDGAHAIFRGVEKLPGINHDGVKLEFLDGTMFLDVDKIYRLQPYNGNAKLNKMPTKLSSKKSKTKDIISNIMNVDKSDLSGILKYSTLIIAPKQKIFDLVKDFKVSTPEGSYEFTSIFPCAYYPGVDTVHNFPGNYSKGEPLIKFVSKMSTAIELILGNKENIKSIIIFGEGMYQNSIHDVEQILLRKSIHDTTIVLDWSNIKTIDYLLNEDNKSNVYAWNEQALLDNVNLYTKKFSNISAYIYENQFDLISTYLDRQTNLQIVECSNRFVDLLTETRNLIKSIADTEVEDEEKDEFVRIAYSLVILFEKSCFPIRYIENAIEDGLVAPHPHNVINQLDFMTRRLLDRVLPISYENKLDKIITNLKELREILLDENPKWAKLNSLIHDMEPGVNALVLPKKYHSMVLINNNKDLENYIELCVLSRFKPNELYDNIVFTGFYEHKNFDLFNNCYVKKFTFMLYPSEVGLFKWRKQQNDKILHTITERNLLVDGDNEDHTEPKVNEESIGFSEADSQTVIQLDELMLKLLTKQASQPGTSYDSSRMDTVESVRTILFESGEKSFLTKYFKPSVIDRENENIIDKNIEELCVGDELVYVKSEVNAQRDIIESIIIELIKNEGFKKQYERLWELSNYWKTVIRRYMSENNCSEAYISRKLLDYNVSRNPATIAQWIKSNKILGPTEEEVYEALALVTDDEYFIGHSHDVYTACGEIRKLQMRLKRYLAASIVRSVVDEEKSEFDILVESTVGDLSSLANVVQVEQIFEKVVEIPFYLANRLIED